MEYPESSVLARITGLLSVLVIFASIVTFCVETLPRYQLHDCSTSPDANGTINNTTMKCIKKYEPYTERSVRDAKQVLDRIEFGSTLWFTFEFLVRLLASPNKWKFFKSILNLIDLCAILPYFLILALESKHGSSFGVIRVARLVRVFRVFKLSRHSLGLQVLGNTLKASINEVCKNRLNILELRNSRDVSFQYIITLLFKLHFETSI